MRELREYIESIIDKKLMATTIGKVVSVNKEAFTCVVKATGTDEEYLDVRLLGASDNIPKPTVFFPKVGSTVGITPLFNSRNLMAVCLITEVDEVLLNGGEFGGLVKADVLKDELDKTNQLLNGILNVINGANIPEPGNGAPSAFQAAVKSALIGKSLGNFDSIKNDTIKHG
jgi:hypothetical protein